MNDHNEIITAMIATLVTKRTVSIPERYVKAFLEECYNRNLYPTEGEAEDKGELGYYRSFNV